MTSLELLWIKAKIHSPLEKYSAFIKFIKHLIYFFCSDLCKKKELHYTTSNRYGWKYLALRWLFLQYIGSTSVLRKQPPRGQKIHLHRLLVKKILYSCTGKNGRKASQRYKNILYASRFSMAIKIRLWRMSDRHQGSLSVPLVQARNLF